MNETIDYIEVGIFDCGVETAGLLTHYGVKSDRIRLIIDGQSTNELYDMQFYSITRIVIGKSSLNYDTIEQYVFKKDAEDQDTAKTVLINQLRALEVEGRTTASGFLTKGTFKNIPDRYKKETSGISAASIVAKQRAATVGGAAANNTSVIPKTGNSTVHNYNNNYQMRNKKTVISVLRDSELPSKAKLKRMMAAVQAVSAGTFDQDLPPLEGDEVIQPPSQAEIDEAMYDVYGQGHLGHRGMY